MRSIRTIIRRHKLDDVRDALDEMGITGITVTEVLGRGRTKGETRIYRGRLYVLKLAPQMQVEVVVNEDVVDDVVRTIMRAARTGAAGDGMVFVSNVDDSYRIRTGEWEG
jgi:nitrogen regulatory protein PII